MAVENRIKEWLLPKLKERGLSVEMFARKCGLSRAIIYFYFTDKYRPDSTTMAEMCKILGVPFEEGLRQYTPNQKGRPAGTKTVTVSSRRYRT